jgi:homoaconitase/3-isopropylmalate dehydratase large subunit
MRLDGGWPGAEQSSSTLSPEVTCRYAGSILTLATGLGSSPVKSRIQTYKLWKNTLIKKKFLSKGNLDGFAKETR